MTLATGARLGSYEVSAPVGAGGMGEVYRARDTKLGRDVALKVLPEAVARDAERLARLRREAQVLASLNHPSIAAIYGFEDSGGTHALVMELVEGQTLAERISGSANTSAPRTADLKVAAAKTSRNGAIPLEEALPIAKQIAEGLEYAHERGIIHRDLKPANIKITGNDSVKILDFGLGKALEGETGSIDISSSPTISRMATQAGIILGTAAYMSPEQAKGKSVDRRTDIWAFGCVLYEMLTGKMAFSGETVTDTLAAVIKSEPDWTQLPATTPQAMRNLLQRCLKKDAQQRSQSIGDVRISLEEILSGAAHDESAGTGSVKPPLQRAWSRALPWAAFAAVLAVALVVLGVMYYTRRPAPQSLLMASINPPAGVFPETLGRIGPPQISSDGKSIAFIGCKSVSAASTISGNAACSVWVRSLDSTDAHEVAGTSGGYFPFWSPDGRELAFFADGKLKRVAADGGPVQIVCDAEDGRGGSWGSSGIILFAATRGSPIFRVSADGGTPVAVTRSAPASDVGVAGSHRWPQFLPDGQHFLYNSGPNGSCNDRSALHFASLDGKQDVSLMSSCGGASFAAGHLLYWRDGNLVAQRFDARRGVLSGTPVPIVAQVALDSLFSLADFSASADGKLVYVAGAGGIASQLTWYDRTGKIQGTIGENNIFGSAAVSPDGSRVLADVERGLLLFDARGTRTLVTLRSGFHAWSADGRQVYFTSDAKGSWQILVADVDRSGNARPVVTFDQGRHLPTFLAASPDGKFLTYADLDAAGAQMDIYTIALTGEPKPRLFRHSVGDNNAPAFSPDGKWLAYESTQSGRREVYITPFPAGGAEYQVSVSGGERPIWRRDGKEIFYREGLMLMAVEVGTKNGAMLLGAPKALFEVAARNLNGRWYDVSPDGRFLVNGSGAQQQAQSFGLIVNWPAKVSR